jgi:hypothetical protein
MLKLATRFERGTTRKGTGKSPKKEIPKLPEKETTRLKTAARRGPTSGTAGTKAAAVGVRHADAFGVVHVTVKGGRVSTAASAEEDTMAWVQAHALI